LFSFCCHFHHCASLRVQKYFAESSSFKSEMMRLMRLTDFWKWTE
jgi:hypothetical protein